MTAVSPISVLPVENNDTCASGPAKHTCVPAPSPTCEAMAALICPIGSPAVMA
jgi:hypothetical protein